MEGDPAGANWVPWGDEVPDLRSRAAVSEYGISSLAASIDTAVTTVL
jgi:hypothetical protein